jgi:hypothetical protein
MTAINGAAPATAPAVSEGQIEERQEGLLDTKSKPNLATILRTLAELFPRIDMDAYRDVLAREEAAREELLERLGGEEDAP